MKTQNIQIRSIKEPHNPGIFSIQNLTQLLKDGDMFEKIHRHDFFYILVIHSGKGNHQIDFENFNISGNSIFILKPGQVHQLYLKKDSQGYLICFETDFYQIQDIQTKKVFNTVNRVNLFSIPFNSFQNIKPHFDAIYNEHTSQQSLFKKSIITHLTLIYIELFRLLKNDISLKKTGSYEEEVLENLIELIEHNAHQQKQVSFYALSLNLTAFQLNSVLKTTLGKTCLQLLNEQLVLESKRNLLATTNQVKEIAFQLGYDDPSYFSRFFKKHTGYTPDNFRKKYQ
ncbi:AraC-type DNA-binding protein [Tenacibaculum sp. MAR_2009_124]|uniref:helix-turn-helix domain-containing protein n=1 Tax=Tenacibaculum sp. MAR_2009_124 TaxID=1250059 RepID=UPI000895EFB0|nr:helix-turn-helix domain-containing protein [Tenacibaculum sp. MAR_2009_124]SEB81579.1 AraC-type DNA-binding protein [Tenacibaculum sp. MAR_2009_124]